MITGVPNYEQQNLFGRGAAKDNWFSHLAVKVHGGGSNEWLEAVTDEEYNKLK